MPLNLFGFENLLAIYGYGLQIYCDFSDIQYCNRCRINSGFRLPVNFNSPYKAKVNWFWKRWHISLSQWFDYLYISLGETEGKDRTYSTYDNYVACAYGMASLKFVSGGTSWHWVGINKLWNSIFKSHLRPTWIGRLFAVFITFQFVSFCWIFFRAQIWRTWRLC